jgi:hypothetical protein
MRALSAALFACLLATQSPGLAQDDPSATRGVFAPGQSAAAPGQSADAPGQSAGVSPLQPTAPSVSVTGAATPSAGYRRGDQRRSRSLRYRTVGRRFTFPANRPRGVRPWRRDAAVPGIPAGRQRHPWRLRSRRAGRRFSSPDECPARARPCRRDAVRGIRSGRRQLRSRSLRSWSVRPRLAPRADSQLAWLLHCRDPRLPRRLHPPTGDAGTSDTEGRHPHADPRRAWARLRCGQRSPRYR